ARGTTSPSCFGDSDEYEVIASMHIRFARVEDVERLAELWLDLYRMTAHFSFMRGIQAGAEERLRAKVAHALRQHNEAIFVAEDGGGALVAMQWVAIQRSDIVIPERKAYLWNSYVVPSHRRQGYMRALMEACERWIQEQGVELGTLWTDDHTDVSERTFRALGYEREGYFMLTKTLARSPSG
ncbi:MAG: GNAT family N-acetyltransferase, partial [bacterium]|nr:GNAT family N-acetyltransferase [bacterium]